MTANIPTTQNSRFKIGWTVLIIIAALSILGHLTLIFVLSHEATLFVGYTAFELYAFGVLWIPFRRFEKWAWIITRILPGGLAFPAFNNPEIAIYYFSAAALCTLGLLLTMPDFFKK